MTTHTKISYVKSGLRIAGYFNVAWIAPYLWPGCLLLIVAEILGIVEELPGAYKGTKTS